MSSPKVLLVDDEKDFLDIIAKRLARRKIDVQGVYGGRQALEKLAAEPFDVVVLDVKMPEMDGITTLKEIKKAHPIVEIILLTGHADMEAAVMGIDLGAFDYMLKPADLDELLYKIEDAYKRKILNEKTSNV